MRMGRSRDPLRLGPGRRRALLLERCAESVRVYNSIDAPALRIPEVISRHIDIFLTSAAWQSEEVRRRHPDAIIEVHADRTGIRVAGDVLSDRCGQRTIDVIYVAAAQDYKRHDILFDAFAKLPAEIRGLCLFGYGENAERYRDEIERRGLNITCLGPPGVRYLEVNALMNRARIGVVCGEADGAPAILTEYMLAGLPVLANEALCCGLQFITPDTVSRCLPRDFTPGSSLCSSGRPAMRPRDVVLEHWAWERTIARFSDVVERARQRKRAGRS